MDPNKSIAEREEDQAMEVLRGKAFESTHVNGVGCACIICSPHFHNCPDKHRKILVSKVPSSERVFEAVHLAEKMSDTFLKDFQSLTIAQQQAVHRFAALRQQILAAPIPIDMSKAIHMDTIREIASLFNVIFFQGYLERVILTDWTRPSPIHLEARCVAMTMMRRPVNDQDETVVSLNAVTSVRNGFPPLLTANDRFEYQMSALLHELAHALFSEHSCILVPSSTMHIFCGGYYSMHGKPFQIITQAIELASPQLLGFTVVTGRASSLVQDMKKDPHFTPSECDLRCYRFLT